MSDNEQKSQLWKTYGILMGIMIGGSAIVLVGQSVWNGIQVEQTRQANLENETYDKYTQLFQKVLVNNEIASPPTDRTSDISKAKQYCSDIGSNKTNPQQDWKKVAATPNIDLKQATSLVQIQVYCPENLAKLPKEAQTQLSMLNNITKKEATALIQRWLDAKKSLFAPPFDKSLGAEILTGKAYQQNIDKSSTGCNNSSDDCLSSMDWLRQNNAEYTYGIQKLESVSKFESGADAANITVSVTETRTLHQSGKNTNSGGTKQARYELKKENGTLKILDYKVLD